jgi:hypothetical protein
VIIWIVIALILAIGAALIVAVARDEGPTATDVAIGYARAVGAADFDALYSMTDTEQVGGRNRAAWVETERARPHAVLAVDDVRVARFDVTGDAARVELIVDASGRSATVDLVRRERAWGVSRFVVAPTPATGPR